MHKFSIIELCWCQVQLGAHYCSCGSCGWDLGEDYVGWQRIYCCSGNIHRDAGLCRCHVRRDLIDHTSVLIWLD